MERERGTAPDGSVGRRFALFWAKEAGRISENAGTRDAVVDWVRKQPVVLVAKSLQRDTCS